MKARLESGKIVKYNKLPKSLKTNSGLILNVSESKAKELGFLDIITPNYNPNTQVIYNIHISSSEDLGEFFTYDVKDKTTSVSIEDAKFAKLEELRISTHDRLKETDWYFIRKAETGQEVPVSVISARKEIRDQHDTKDAEILSLTNVIDVINY